MDKIYKWISVVLCIAFLCTPLSVYAYGSMTENDQEQEKQDRIEEIFSELNSLALEKYKLSNDLADTKSAVSIKAKTIAIHEQELDNRLSELGVIKIEPDDEEALRELGSLIGSNHSALGGKASGDDVDDYVNRLTTFFSVYRYNGKYKVDGTEYTYSYIRVVDNKGKGLYTKSVSEVNMLNRTPNTVADLLSYNFSFGLGQFLGRFKYYAFVDWTIGNISTIYKNLNPSARVTQVGRGSIYSATIMSKTQMTYYIVYMPQYPPGVLTGSRADAKISISEILKANVDGSIKTDKRDLEDECSTGESWYWYLENFVRTSNTTHHKLGYFTLKCMNQNVVTFEPLYFKGPVEVLYK